MIQSRLKMYERMYLELRNENACLKHAAKQHEDELNAKQQMLDERECRIREVEEENKLLRTERVAISGERDAYKQKYESECESHAHTKSVLKEAKTEITKLQEGKEALKLSEEANVDLKSVVDILQRRLFQTNSDASAYMHGSMELDERRLEEMGFEEVVGEAKKLVDELNADTDNSPVDTGKQPPLPDSDNKDKPKDEPKRKRNVFPIKVLDSMGIDTSNLPPGFKLIHRKDKDSGEDVWIVRMYDFYPALAGCIEYEIGRFNVPGHDPMCSKHPDHIIGSNPLLPSFARFYFDMKIHYNVSENRILEMLKDMEAFMPQSSLNKWIHEVMKVSVQKRIW